MGMDKMNEKLTQIDLLAAIPALQRERKKGEREREEKQ
jgi:hypothetical protein